MTPKLPYRGIGAFEYGRSVLNIVVDADGVSYVGVNQLRLTMVAADALSFFCAVLNGKGTSQGLAIEGCTLMARFDDGAPRLTLEGPGRLDPLSGLMKKVEVDSLQALFNQNPSVGQLVVAARWGWALLTQTSKAPPSLVVVASPGVPPDMSAKPVKYRLPVGRTYISMSSKSTPCLMVFERHSKVFFAASRHLKKMLPYIPFEQLH
jgi:hypothetical protein